VTPPPASTASARPQVKSPVATPPEPHVIEVNKAVVRRPDDPRARDRAAERAAAEKREQEREQERERQREQAEREWAARVADTRRQQVGSALSALRGGLSERTVVPEPIGPGGGGETYAGYDLYVVSLYQRAFRPPAEIADARAVTRVRVTIARDGSVTAQIITRSGIAVLDRAVQAVLDRIRTVGQPLPQELKEDQHTIIIRFDVTAKQPLG